jgi:hypothetical protein
LTISTIVIIFLVLFLVTGGIYVYTLRGKISSYTTGVDLADKRITASDNLEDSKLSETLRIANEHVKETDADTLLHELHIRLPAKPRG